MTTGYLGEILRLWLELKKFCGRKIVLPIRAAVISDIHGNSGAFAAVLADIKRQAVDFILNLGDSFSGPLDPRGTAEMLLREKIVSVAGNSDRAILEAGAAPNPTLTYVCDSLTAKVKDWLKTLTKSRVVADIFFLCHGTAYKDDEYLMEKITEQGVGIKSVQELAAQLQSIRQSIILCGHSHLVKVIELPGHRYIINPGSVGLPAYSDELPYPHAMAVGTPHARYAIVTYDAAGTRIEIENRLIVYDWQAAAIQAERNGRPDWAGWLRTGMVESIV